MFENLGNRQVKSDTMFHMAFLSPPEILNSGVRIWKTELVSGQGGIIYRFLKNCASKIMFMILII